MVLQLYLEGRGSRRWCGCSGCTRCSSSCDQRTLWSRLGYTERRRKPLEPESCPPERHTDEGRLTYYSNSKGEINFFFPPSSYCSFEDILSEDQLNFSSFNFSLVHWFPSTLDLKISTELVSWMSNRGLLQRRRASWDLTPKICFIKSTYNQHQENWLKDWRYFSIFEISSCWNW